ncbi:MAG: type I methionyl aminopeptidase [Acidobacteria bacterium]|nr:type I methionyl aminopeptidase [Acidobacteriota bacterium]
MSIRSEAELEKMQIIGRIVRATLDAMTAAVQPGVTTSELDGIALATLTRHGAESSPPKAYGFPGTACISVNDEAIHGIPGCRVLAEGDLVKLDVTAEKDGFVADAAVTVRAGNVSVEAEALARCAESAFRMGMRAAQVGSRVYEIGRAVEREVYRCGFSVLKDFCGHGVGRAIHEEPTIPNHFDPRYRTKLTEGLVITVEPIISAGNGRAERGSDRWTIRTADGSMAAHHEHTMVITRTGPQLLTAA